MSRRVIVTETNQWMGTGPSVRARARLALATAFLVAVSTLFVGVLRTTGVSEEASSLTALDNYWRHLVTARLEIEELKTVLWRFEAQPEVEHERAILEAYLRLKASLVLVVQDLPKELDEKSLQAFKVLSERLGQALRNALEEQEKQEMGNRQAAVARARLILTTLSSDTKQLENQLQSHSDQLQNRAIVALSRIGRDQLVLFLLLLLVFPVFVGFMPSWIMAPLIRLKRIKQYIENGRIRELQVAGEDEISSLATTLKEALVWREDLDAKKSGKIFEVRNILRALINLVDEPVLIIAQTGRINYANQPAAALFGKESHHLESTLLSDHVYAPAFLEHLDDAFEGNLVDEDFKADIEMPDGRMHHPFVRLRGVRNRDGDVSRVVVVFIKEERKDAKST